MVNTHSNSHTSSRLNVSGSVKSVITYLGCVCECVCVCVCVCVGEMTP
jgi:hypothetical protein